MRIHFITLFLLLLLSACASVEKQSSRAGAAPSQLVLEGFTSEEADQLIADGNYRAAAGVYLQIASEAQPPERQLWKMKAAEALLNDKQYPAGKALLDDIDTSPLNDSQRNLLALLRAKLALGERSPEEAMFRLGGFSLTSDTPVAQRIDYLQLLVRVYELSGMGQEAVRERVTLDTLLDDPTLKIQNQQNIIQTLMLMNEKTLQQMLDENPHPVLRGWTDIALMALRTPDPARLANLLNNWKAQHPDHPVNEDTLTLLAPRGSADTLPPNMDHIALLLPFEGAFKKSAEAVRDGFLTAYYAQQSNDIRPVIRIYNSAANEESIVDLYEEAIDNGAGIVVGPLAKQTVEELAHSGRIEVPTLALNQVEDLTFYTENLYMFGLSPEIEAQQVAERAWAEGHNRAAAIYPSGSWGKRVFDAFKTRWEALGGELAASNEYEAKRSDFSKPIVDMLDLDESNRRYRNLQRLVGSKLDHEPRRRQDIDMIFMAAFPRQARLIPPQLKFHHAGDIPIYTTSHSFTGVVNRKEDRDMNGVIIGDMPWTLPVSNKPPLQNAVVKHWPDTSSQYGRLYALGVDAYNVLYYLNWLRANPNASLSGATGKLSMDNQNHLLRTLSWAKFKSGRPVIYQSTPFALIQP